MAERTKRQNEIVEKMIEDALVSANEFERECEVFAAREKIDEVADVMGELGDWLSERDAVRLSCFGVQMEVGVNGHLSFRMNEKEGCFSVRPGPGLAITAGDKQMLLDPDLPMLDDGIYDEVLRLICDWAGVTEAGQRKRFEG
jgi:hypothetical protein